VFLEKDIVHHDLKAQNIVYNEETNRINFIDFGLMTSRKELIESSRNSNNRNALPHWSYPFELQYLNKRLFERLCSLQQRYKINIVKNILDDMDRGYISSPYITFFNSIMPNSSEDLFTKNMNIMLNDFMDFLLELKENNYDDFLNKSINTIDTYGVGIAFTTVLSNCAKFIEPNLLTSLSEIFAFMMCAHLPSRYEPAEVLHKYEELMHTSGLLEKHNKYYDNHIIKEGKAKPDGIAKLVSKVDPTNLILSPDEIEKLADRPPMICRSGEEQHPLERRCIKKCKDGKVRNEKFRCVKNKTVKKLSK
jgi:serine/threonine protein kinase